jgi:signal-transduction protein with cAMP-binding, CBS, and nucleotidyltransferase domain
LVVVDVNGKLQGVVTERDLVRKVCIQDVRTDTVTNKEIMSHPITIDSSSSPSIAAHMMLQTNVKHLLVVDKTNVNKPIGIITPVDLKYTMLYTDEELKILWKSYQKAVLLTNRTGQVIMKNKLESS